jgi:uncharacterized phiE125 gp8 family phage protein
MNLTVIVQPRFEPVSLAEVYKQLRLDPDHANSPSELSHPDDALLATHIAAAREYVEIATRRSLVLRTIRLTHPCWPGSCDGWTVRRHNGYSRILLRRPPVVRVLSVGYYDGENALQEVDAADYYIDDGHQIPELRFISGFGSATTYDRSDAVRIDYEAGYVPDGSPPEDTQQAYAQHVPATLKQCVLLGVQLLYDNLAPEDRDRLERMREALLQSMRIQHV